MFLCLAGAILNIILSKICAMMNIPLYMDTVLTVTVTLIGGPVWGSLCGALTNIINHTIWFWSWEAYLFALCNIATAVITWLFKRAFPGELRIIADKQQISPYAAPVETAGSKRRDRPIDRVFVLFLLSLALCIAMSILGGILTALILGIDPSLLGQEGLMAKLGSALYGRGFPLILVEILSRIPINIIDRLLTAFGGYGIALLAAAFYIKIEGRYFRRNV